MVSLKDIKKWPTFRESKAEGVEVIKKRIIKEEVTAFRVAIFRLVG